MGMAALADRRNNKAETRRWLDSAVRADPGGVKPSLALAEYYAAAEDPAAAVTVMEALSERQPRNPQLLFALGRFHTWAGEPAAAVRSYQRLVELDGGTTRSEENTSELQSIMRHS